jgi:GT2 family glycosyltransferase
MNTDSSEPRFHGASLGVVILTHGQSREAPELAAALLQEGVPPSRVAVVHNPAHPHDPAIEVPEGVDVIRMDKNAGYAVGMNAGIRHQLESGVEFVLILTHDARLLPGALEALVDALSAHDRFAVLGPILEGDEGVWSAGKKLHRGNFRHIPEAPTGDVAPCDSVDGSVMLCRTQALLGENIAFDERLFMYFEETDLCWRLRERGWRIGIVPTARANSTPGGGRRPATHAYLMCRNGLEVMRARGGWRRCAAYLYQVARLTYAGIPKPWEPRFRVARQRREGVVRLRGTLRGFIDFVIRRFGPPPKSLQDGDLVA